MYNQYLACHTRSANLQSDTITCLPEQVNLPRVNIQVFVFVKFTCTYSMMLEEYIYKGFFKNGILDRASAIVIDVDNSVRL